MKLVLPPEQKQKENCKHEVITLDFTSKMTLIGMESRAKQQHEILKAQCKLWCRDCGMYVDLTICTDEYFVVPNNRILWKNKIKYRNRIAMILQGKHLKYSILDELNKSYFVGRNVLSVLPQSKSRTFRVELGPIKAGSLVTMDDDGKVKEAQAPPEHPNCRSNPEKDFALIQWADEVKIKLE